MKKNPDLGLFILRIGIGLLMLLHGIAKLKGVTGIEKMLSESGLPSFLAYGVYVTEIIAPILIVVGYRTRLASLVFVSGVLVAIFLAHSGDIFTLTQHGAWKIELLGLYLCGSITLLLSGAGKMAVSTKHKWD